MKMNHLKTLAASLVMGSSVALASPADTPEKVIKFAELVKKQVHQDYKVRKLPEADLYEIGFADGVLFVTPNARYVFEGGNLIDTSSGKSLTREYNATIAKRILNAIPEELMFTYSPKGDSKSEIFVYLDPGCPHCQDFNSQLLPKLLENGITVHYIPFPLGGPNSDSAKAFAAAFCSKNPEESLQQAFKGQKLTGGEKCVDRVQRAQQTGIDLQVHGTPTIFSKSGSQLSQQDLIRMIANLPKR